ncbi:hypothetical protein F4777DRAFT_433926 [Nemania sp. FL0916]|nr:hypothetical protein F4777DRAFT_433926 [Nemania sp. FL0916]
MAPSRITSTKQPTVTAEVFAAAEILLTIKHDSWEYPRKNLTFSRDHFDTFGQSDLGSAIINNAADATRDIASHWPESIFWRNVDGDTLEPPPKAAADDDTDSVATTDSATTESFSTDYPMSPSKKSEKPNGEGPNGEVPNGEELDGKKPAGDTPKKVPKTPSREAVSTKGEASTPSTRKLKTSSRSALLREIETAEGPRRKELFDQLVEATTSEWMQKAGGDHMKAAEFYFKSQEEANQRPWAEEISAKVQRMRKDRLDPKMLQQEMEEEQAEENATRKGKLNRGHRLQDAKDQDVPNEASVAAPGSSKHIPAVNTPKYPTPLPSLAVQQPQSLIASKDVEELSAPIPEASIPPPQTKHQHKEQDAGSESPKKKRRKTAAETLRSDLGEHWNPGVTDDGHRPCVNGRRDQTSESKGSG